MQIYGDAAAAYAALDQRLLSEQGGIYFFGSKPSSLDALLFSHLSYQNGAPTSAPELRQAVGALVLDAVNLFIAWQKLQKLDHRVYKSCTASSSLCCLSIHDIHALTSTPDLRQAVASLTADAQVQSYM